MGVGVWKERSIALKVIKDILHVNLTAIEQASAMLREEVNIYIYMFSSRYKELLSISRLYNYLMCGYTQFFPLH